MAILILLFVSGDVIWNWGLFLLGLIHGQIFLCELYSSVHQSRAKKNKTTTTTKNTPICLPQVSGLPSCYTSHASPDVSLPEAMERGSCGEIKGKLGCNANQPAKPRIVTKTICLNIIGQLERGKVGRRKKLIRCFGCETSDPALLLCKSSMLGLYVWIPNRFF